jgi:hypothetical protein
MSNPVITLEFPFAVDKPTANGRIYPREVMETAIANYQKAMSERSTFGELGEGEGRVSLSKVSHIVLALKIEDDDVIKGDVEVLPTDNGKTLAFLHASELPLTLAPVGSIDVDPDTGKVSSLKLHYVNVVADPIESK